jgi:NitT/TauT family transport system substrate-binding protein
MITPLLNSVLILLLSLTLFLQGSFSYAKEQIQSKPVKLKLVYMPYITSAPFLIAEEEGFFTSEGLQIEFVQMGDAMDALPALIQGNVDVLGNAIYPALLNAMARGANIKIVADKGYLPPTGCTYAAILARRALVEGGELSSISQLKGRRVAQKTVSDVTGYILEKVLLQSGLTLADVQMISLTNPMRLEAFAKGTIDITFGFEPWLTRFLKEGHTTIWKSIHQLIPNFQMSLLLYGPTLLEKNPNAGKRFMVAYLKAVRQYNRGKIERNIEILAKRTDWDRELLEKCCWPPFHDKGQINIESITDFQLWALKKGFLDKEVSPHQFWDPSFIEYTNKVLDTAKK